MDEQGSGGLPERYTEVMAAPQPLMQTDGEWPSHFYAFCYLDMIGSRTGQLAEPGQIDRRDSEFDQLLAAHPWLEQMRGDAFLGATRDPQQINELRAYSAEHPFRMVLAFLWTRDVTVSARQLDNHARDRIMDAEQEMKLAGQRFAAIGAGADRLAPELIQGRLRSWPSPDMPAWLAVEALAERELQVAFIEDYFAEQEAYDQGVGR